MDEQQIRRIIREEIQNVLGRHDHIPFDVQKALARRFKLAEVPTISAGSKSATAENQAVDEGGAGTYSVLKPPDRFRLLTDANGTTIGYVAVWD